jgi:hypothetical protein
MRFPASCIGSPERLRFSAYGQLYHDSGMGIIGGDYAPDGGSPPTGSSCADGYPAGRPPQGS